MRFSLHNILGILFCIQFMACSTAKQNYMPNKKYAVADLQEDYRVLQEVLEKKHPSLYWYNDKATIDKYFNRYTPTDSMTEQQFLWLCVTPMVNKIRCGHTSAYSSKAYSKWSKNKILFSFPYFIKPFNDSLVVLASTFTKSPFLKRGTVITSINDVKA
jgi:hypothetical protein